MSENNNNNQQGNQIQIQLRPELADGKFSNLAMIGHDPNEFLIDFIFHAPNMPQAPVVSRIIMTPGERQTASPGSAGQRVEI